MLTPYFRKHVAREAMATPGCTVGCDYSGIVEEVGSKVTKEWKKGDRVAGFTHGVNKVELEDGCFAEYARHFCLYVCHDPDACMLQVLCGESRCTN